MVNIIDWFKENFIWVKVVSTILSVFFLYLIVKLMKEMKYFSGYSYAWNVFRSGVDDKKRITIHWNRILKHVTSKNPDQWKAAVPQADKLLDEVLKIAGCKGNTIEERLDSLEATTVPTIGDLKRVRSEVFSILTEEKPSLEREKLKELLREYRNVIRQLGMLE